MALEWKIQYEHRDPETDVGLLVWQDDGGHWHWTSYDPFGDEIKCDYENYAQDVAMRAAATWLSEHYPELVAIYT